MACPSYWLHCLKSFWETTVMYLYWKQQANTSNGSHLNHLLQKKKRGPSPALSGLSHHSEGAERRRSQPSLDLWAHFANWGKSRVFRTLPTASDTATQFCRKQPGDTFYQCRPSLQYTSTAAKYQRSNATRATVALVAWRTSPKTIGNHPQMHLGTVGVTYKAPTPPTTVIELFCDWWLFCFQK